jgi:flagellar biosynthesis/type III secretory pathway protein FliH
MSNQATRRISVDEIAALVQKGGSFVQDARSLRDADEPFIPWGKTKFRSLDDIRAEEELSKPTQEKADEPTETLTPPTEEPAPQEAQEASAAPPPAPPPPPPPKETGPSPEEIVAELDKAREDGRALGYQQGLAAARDEFKAALDTIRTLEAQLTTATEDAITRNAAVMARHIRRLAQDLAGTVFADMPHAFIERIHKAAETFTRAGTDFTLLLNEDDARVLHEALASDELFSRIRITPDPDLPKGAFKLSSRDLEYEDTPHIDEIEAE